ncbi:MAG: DUF4012 domain-containing protein [bacterium]|nr:DUF4012 domain-containing protein [bacterium]
MPAKDENIVRSLEGQPLEPLMAPETLSAPPHSRGKFAGFPWKKIGLGLGLFLAVIIGFAGMIFMLSRPLVASTNKLKESANVAVAAAKAQDLGQVQTQLVQVEKDLNQVKRDYGRMVMVKFVPFVGSYYRDGQHGLEAASHLLTAANATVVAIAPYADVIGLKGLSTSTDGVKTAEDRLNFIIETLDKVEPQLDAIGGELTAAKKEVDQINPNRYPQTFRGQEIRPKLIEGIGLLDQAATLATEAKPLLASAPYMLGKDAPRKYLVLFQNDAELRPTGGFLTAYAVIEVNNGKVNIVQSNDIYTLDEKFKERIPAPDPIKKYLANVPYWYLRDQNLSPDFKVSMDMFYPNYLKTKSPEVDGIVAVDTQLLVDLLKVTGPIGVHGFGTYSADIDERCNCPQVWYELEKFADQEGPVVWDPAGTGKIIFAPRNYGARKSFIGPMMQAVLANTMAQPKDRIPKLFDTVMRAISAKHVQLFFNKAEVQTAVESFNLAGRVREFDGDYLMVVDTNFAGAKTNAWVTYTAKQEIEVGGDGSVTKTLTLTYKNPQEFFSDAGGTIKLNGKFRDWLRVYVPKGSELIEAKGFESGDAVGEDLGKTVFEGFFTLTPLNVRTVSFKYKLPLKMKGSYKLLIQKQGGANYFPYQTSINGRNQPEVILNSDKELVFSL